MQRRYAANVTPTGVATFFKAPLVEDFEVLGDKIALLGVPYDLGVGYRPGARFGPRAVREASTRLGPLDGKGFFDIDAGESRLVGAQIVDAGDVDVLRGQLGGSLDAMEDATRRLVDAGAFPVLIGGDHSLTGPAVRGLAAKGPFGILQIDAHLDFTDEVMGTGETSSSPLRRAAEEGHVETIVQVGLRGLRTPEPAYRAALERGNVLITREQLRNEDSWVQLQQVLSSMNRMYITIDIDALDPAVAPGVSSPEPDGLSYREVKRLLALAARSAEIVGFDVVETNPMVDPSGATAYVAASLTLELLALRQAAAEERSGG